MEPEISASASWSYTATATLWPYLGRNDWSGVETFGPPVTFACDYSVKTERRTDALGKEFLTRQLIYTERADIKQKDRVLIGEHLGHADPIAAGADEVKLVQRYSDLFDRLADDLEVST